MTVVVAVIRRVFQPLLSQAALRELDVSGFEHATPLQPSLPMKANRDTTNTCLLMKGCQVRRRVTAAVLNTTAHGTASPATLPYAALQRPYSHSIVAGGLEEIS